MPEFSVTATAFGLEEKVAARSGPRASHVYLPIEWTGKKVMVLLLEDLEDDEDNKPLSTEEGEGLKEAGADIKAGRIHSEADIKAAFEVDDEPLSAEEEEELKEAVADVKAGNYRPLDDVLREHGLL